KDNLGSTRVVTDSTGSKLEESNYLPYGENLENSDETFGFTGKEQDLSGLTYFGARYYDPSLGVFVTVDPIKDGMNHYQYAASNPLKYVDPTGTRLHIIPFFSGPYEVEWLQGESTSEDVRERILNKVVGDFNLFFGQEILEVEMLSIGRIGFTELEENPTFETEEQTKIYEMLSTIINHDLTARVYAMNKPAGDAETYHKKDIILRAIYNPSESFEANYGADRNLINFSPFSVLVHELAHISEAILQGSDSKSSNEAYAVRHENYARKVLGMSERVYYRQYEKRNRYEMITPENFDKYVKHFWFITIVPRESLEIYSKD
ncbi:MAG: RHS repeat-associated core domain-containing protein, partial [Nanoarchaeota archaeon]